MVILVCLKFSSVTNLAGGWQKSDKEKEKRRVAQETGKVKTGVSNLYTERSVQNSRACSW